MRVPRGNIVIRTVEFALFGAIILHILDGLYLTPPTARPARCVTP